MPDCMSFPDDIMDFIDEYSFEDRDWVYTNGSKLISSFRVKQAVEHYLLREQEAIKPYMDYDGQGVWRCGKCGNSLMHPSYYESDEDAKNYIRYCSHCGRKVKWDADHA